MAQLDHEEEKEQISQKTKNKKRKKKKTRVKPTTIIQIESTETSLNLKDELKSVYSDTDTNKLK